METLEKPKGKHGGARPGGGRKKGGKNAETISKELAREALRVIVMQHMQAMTEAQIDAAKGIKYLVKRSKLGGTFQPVTKEHIAAGVFEDPGVIIEVWDKQPSTSAFTDLMNRALDKPAEQKMEIDVTINASLLEARMKAAAMRELKAQGKGK